MRHAYLQTKRAPGCLADYPHLVVPFVAEVSAVIRNKRLHVQALQVTLACESVKEPAYARAGGSSYLAVRSAMETAQDRYLGAYCERHSSSDDSSSSDLNRLSSEMKRHQMAFYAVRRRHEPFVQKTCTAAARSYWSTRPVRGIPDTFFADALPHTAAARMQRIHPPWWGLFLSRLQQTLVRGHPAEGLFLDELPRLRRAAKRKTLEALVTEWSEANADRLGWYTKIYDRALSDRAMKKAEQIAEFIDARAPGYRTREGVRLTLHAELADRLATADPWPGTTSPFDSFALLSEHGDN